MTSCPHWGARCSRSTPGDGLVRFLDDGRIEIDSNVVERAIRPIALNRKNALFAGSDGGGEHWAILASLIETCKLNGVDPQAYLAYILARIAIGHPINRLDGLLPWTWRKTTLDSTTAAPAVTAPTLG
jgi:transposase